MKVHALNTFRNAAVFGVGMLVVSGCNKKADNSINYKSAINAYYSAHPSCLFSQPVQFPTQKTTSDQSATAPYDALVDQGLLVRTTAEKKVFIVASKQVTNYDLSSNGRSAWTADTTQPGFGNFCYGHRSVSTIDSSTPTSSDVGATTQINLSLQLFRCAFVGERGRDKDRVSECGDRPRRTAGCCGNSYQYREWMAGDDSA